MRASNKREIQALFLVIFVVKLTHENSLSRWFQDRWELANPQAVVICHQDVRAYFSFGLLAKIVSAFHQIRVFR